MFQILLFILIVLMIFTIGFFVGRRGIKNATGLQKAWLAKKERKEDSKKKILELFEKQDSLHNSDIQKLLSASDATATIYLEELEQEGKITQHGDAGRGVFYTKINA